MKPAKEVSEFAEDIINTVREPLIVLDKDLRVVKASRSFYDFFRVTPADTIGTLIYDLGNNQWDIPKLRELLETILPDKTSFDNYEVEHVFPAIGKRIMLLNARKIQRGSGKEQIILLAIEDITEHKMAEEALSVSENRYHGLFESARDGILILDSETGKIIDVNPILVNMLGYSKEHFINKTIWEIGVFKNIVANQDKYLEFQQKGYNRFEHLPLETKDGRRIDIEFVSHVNIAHQQKVTQCNIRDITQHIQVGELLRESEERFRHSFEYSAISICILGLDFKFQRINNAFKEMFGYDDNEIKNFTFSDITHPDDLSIGLDIIKKMLLGEIDKASFEKRYIKKDKSIIWAYISSSIVRNVDNKPQFFITQIINITLRKQLEESLKKQKEEFETIFNLVPAQIWYKDTHNNFIRVNHQTCTDLGMPADKIEGHSAEELFPSFATQYFKDDLEVLNSRKPKLGIIEQVNVTGGDIRWVNTDKIPVFGHDGEASGLIAVVQDITERKKSEEALHNSETLLRTLVQTIPDLIWLKDVNGVYLSCNKMFERFFGARESDIVGKTDFEFIDRELADFFLENDRKAMEAGKPTSNEEWVTFADDGHRAFLDTIKTPMYDSRGTIIGILGIGRDITERKRSEKVIRESEKRFRAIFDQAPIAIALLDMQGFVIIANSTLSKMVGYTNGELSKMKFIDFTFPEDVDKDLKQFIDLTDGKISHYSMEKRYVHKNGNIIWANISVTILRDENGISHEIIGMAEDITERKHAEKELQESEKRYKELTTLLPQSVFESDINGVITFANDYATKTFGFDKEEVLNKLTLQEMIIPEEKEKLTDNINRLFQGDNNINKEYTLLKKDHTAFSALVYSNPIIKDGKPIGIRGVLIDISEIKKAETELINAKEKAESANKLKDAFIANISHEIRTPLNGILGMSSLIKDIFPGKISKEDEELFDGIEYSSQRLIRTVDMILNYSRLQVGEFPLFKKKIELSVICVKLVTEYTPAAKKKSLDLTFRNNYSDVFLFADQYSIVMAISNLIDNAIKYTKKGFINLILYGGINDEIMLDIKDTGIGINEKSLQNIFEPYRQEQMGYGRAYEGIGLGLSLVKNVLILNNVNISVQSKIGEGTTFSINFGKAVQYIDNIPKTSTSHITPLVIKTPVYGVVLLVEDDIINQSTIKRFLSTRYTLIITDSSDGALEILKNNKINMILMDISIAGNKNGLELTKELKASKDYCNIPVIAITAHAFEKDKLNALDAGCDNYLAKPFSKESLLDMMSEYFHP